MKRSIFAVFLLLSAGSFILLNWRFSFVDSQRSELFGVASFYSESFAGRPTASGTPFDPNLLTAAHRTLPLMSLVKVTNLENDRSVIVKITDRGPYVKDRVIDLSRKAAARLDMTRQGLAKVRIEVLQRR